MYQIDDLALKSPTVTTKKRLLSANPQVTWYNKSTAKNIVYELPHKFPNDFRKLENYEKISKTGVKVNNKNTRARCEICSKLTIKTSEWPQASF